MEQAATCCFTGHRPDKLPWGTDETDPRCLALKVRLDEELERAYDRGWRHFICGMARGCDLYFGEAVLKLKERHGDVTLEGAVPCREQADRWPPEEKERYRALLDRCDLETLVQRQYSPSCMMRRNRYMVDRSSLVLSVYDGGGSGGTMRTLLYALNQKAEIIVIPLSEFE